MLGTKFAVRPPRGIAATKALFLNRSAIANAVDRGRRTALVRGGGYVRKTARNSIKKRKGPSRPGRPPHSRTGLLRAHIYFSWDPGSQTVVIGPAAFAKPTGVPKILERGGSRPSRRNEYARITNGVGRDSSGRFTSQAEWVKMRGRVRIAARPFMLPAMRKSAPKLAQFWRESVHR